MLVDAKTRAQYVKMLLCVEIYCTIYTPLSGRISGSLYEVEKS